MVAFFGVTRCGLLCCVGSFACACARITLLELVDTTGGIHDLVFAGVERMRLGRDLDTNDRILFAVRPLHFFFALGFGSGLGQEFEITRRVKKNDFLGRWMDVSFHLELPFFP